MRARDVVGATACALALLSSGCASTRAPAGWLPLADRSCREAYGGWMVAQLIGAPHDTVAQGSAGKASHSQLEVMGELIAVDRDSVFILPEHEGLRGIPYAAVRRGQVASFDAATGRISGWGVVGSLTTISHGIVLLLTAPVWIVSSSIAANSVSRAPIAAVPGASWTDLKKFARFPQGLPPGLNRSALRPRPATAGSARR